jgi:hypothetical protein
VYKVRDRAGGASIRAGAPYVRRAQENSNALTYLPRLARPRSEIEVSRDLNGRHPHHQPDSTFITIRHGAQGLQLCTTFDQGSVIAKPCALTLPPASIT